MGNMAEEIATRIEADGGAGLAGGDAGGAAGTQGGQAAVAPPPAGESNADNRASGGTPDTIPYARFKEVNDQLAELRGYSEFAQVGYDADSLRRLVNFEANYAQDPSGTVSLLVDNLDLPDAQKEAIKALMSTPTPASAGGETQNGEGNDSAEMSPELKEALEYVRQSKQRDAQAETDRQLETAVNHWLSKDKEDGLTDDKATPRHVVLMHIGQLAGSGQFATLEELAESARKVYMDERDRLLGSAVQNGRSGSPARVPTGPPAASEPVKFASLKEASKAALEDIRAGRLPAMNANL